MVASKLVKYKLDQVAVQEVRWVEGGSQPADDYTFFYANSHLVTNFIIHKGIISPVKGVEFISVRMSYKILRGCWCDIVLNVHALPEDKSYDTKDKLYK
jgi:hypothetical protein